MAGPLKIAFATLALACASSVHAAPEFHPADGPRRVMKGEGGTKQVFDGVEVWTSGRPPRTFVIVGMLTDSRMSSGLVGLARMKSRSEQVARAAKKAGADAAIFVDSTERVSGYAKNGAPITHMDATFSAVRFVDEPATEEAPTVVELPPPSAAPAAVQAGRRFLHHRERLGGSIVLQVTVDDELACDGLREAALADAKPGANFECTATDVGDALPWLSVLSNGTESMRLAVATQAQCATWTGQILSGGGGNIRPETFCKQR